MLAGEFYLSHIRSDRRFYYVGAGKPGHCDYHLGRVRGGSFGGARSVHQLLPTTEEEARRARPPSIDRTEWHGVVAVPPRTLLSGGDDE